MKIAIRFSKCLYIILLGCGMWLTSCRKFIEVSGAKNQITTSEVFKDSADATASLLGLYIKIMSSSVSPGSINGEVTIETGLVSDELVPTSGSSADFSLYSNALSSSGSTSSDWSQGYSYIYQANACIEGITGSSSLNTRVKNQLLGEAKFLRALIYFHLVNQFGGVPLETSTDFNVNAVMPRSSVDSVYSQIMSDLKDAVNNLTEQYPSSGRVRPNKMSALALLSRVYLYKGQWSLAEDAASQVINSGTYHLEDDLNNVFLAGSNEAILQFIPLQAGFETVDGFIFVPGDPSIIPSYSISHFLLDSFEVGDQRKVKWLDSNVVNNGTYYYPYKYKLTYDGNSTPLENYTILRLAELYLIRSEARLRQSKFPDAVDDLNQIRVRAGLSAVSSTDFNEILGWVIHERKIELFCELGQRWYDMKRLGIAHGIMSVVTPAKGGSWDDNWLLFPIPLSQIQTNPYLKQNLGY